MKKIWAVVGREGKSVGTGQQEMEGVITHSVSTGCLSAYHCLSDQKQAGSLSHAHTSYVHVPCCIQSNPVLPLTT